jgi:hypothetical protein
MIAALAASSLCMRIFLAAADQNCHEHLSPIPRNGTSPPVFLDKIAREGLISVAEVCHLNNAQISAVLRWEAELRCQHPRRDNGRLRGPHAAPPCSCGSPCHKLFQRSLRFVNFSQPFISGISN